MNITINVFNWRTDETLGSFTVDEHTSYADIDYPFTRWCNHNGYAVADCDWEEE